MSDSSNTSEAPRPEDVPPASDESRAMSLVRLLLELKRAWPNVVDGEEKERLRHSALIDFAKLSNLVSSWIPTDEVEAASAAGYAENERDRADIIQRINDACSTTETDIAYAILPRFLCQKLLYALIALDSGEVADIVVPTKTSGTKTTYRNSLKIQVCRYAAVCYYHYYRGRGLKQDGALARVAAEFGESPDAIKNWVYGKVAILDIDPLERWGAFIVGAQESGKSIDEALSLAPSPDLSASMYIKDQIKRGSKLPQATVYTRFSDGNLREVAATYRSEIGGPAKPKDPGK